MLESLTASYAPVRIDITNFDALSADDVALLKIVILAPTASAISTGRIGVKVYKRTTSVWTSSSDAEAEVLYYE